MDSREQRTVRSSYAGRRVRRATPNVLGSNTKRMTVQLVASAVVLLALWCVKLWSPSGSEAVRDFVDGQTSGGANYRAALGALGEAISGEGEFSAVWTALNSKSEPVSAVDAEDDETVYADSSPDAGSGGGYYVQKLDSSAKLGMVENALYGDDSDEYVTVSTYLTTEDDEDEEELTGLVSYDFIQPDFEYTTPLQGTKTSGFGYRIHPITKKNSFHYGIDIATASGESIISFADGTVELIGYNSVYGNYLFIRHKDGFLTFYGHCSKITATEGQLVKMGDIVAKVGSTGWSTGPHLHFEVRSGDTILDPTGYVSLG